MANSKTTQQDVATIAPFSIPAEHKAELERIARANHRDLTKELRHLIEKRILEFGPDLKSAS